MHMECRSKCALGVLDGLSAGLGTMRSRDMGGGRFGGRVVASVLMKTSPCSSSVGCGSGRVGRRFALGGRHIRHVTSIVIMSRPIPGIPLV
jgi:hypothetical protein